MPERDRGRDAAVVGMAALFPGARDLDAYFRNLERGVDAIGKAPADRLDPVFYDPTSSAPERSYVERGGFLESSVGFDALAFGVMPVAAEGAEPDQLLSLQIAAHALRDAGYADRNFDRDRASVVIGRGSYLTAGVARLEQRVRGVEQVVTTLRALVPNLDEAQIEAVKDALRAPLGPYGADTAIGLVPNLAASRIANRLDLRGGAYTIDAACASSLVAVDHACRDLESGVSDLVLAGGVHLCHDPTFYSVFCQLGALSRAQTIRPFDCRADGLFIGEGVGMLVLKRLRDAERDGDRIYAVIRGTGVSSDGRGAGLMTPGVDGQVLALRRAWEKAGLEPESVGLIEAHGTATPAGDSAELATLARFFGPHDGGARAGLGSVKSMIGHAMPAAGAAGLIKAVLAVHHGLLLPTLHCEEPRPELEATRFRPIAASEPWESAVRRAGVNAFGFGGINAHVVLESHGQARSVRRAEADARETVLLLGAATPDALLTALDAGDADHGLRGPARIAVFTPTPERLARARAIVARGQPWRGRDDIFFAPQGLLASGGKLAFLFPGVDASFRPRVDDVLSHFELPFESPGDASSLKGLGMGIITVGRALDAALRAIGIRPDVIAGHSIGEWSGMIASEMIPKDAIDEIITGLAPESVDVPGVVFVAAGCGVEQAMEAIAGLDSIAVSHDNCPHQILLCGRAESAAIAQERLVRAGILCQKLPFQSGYHSPLFADYVGPHQRILASLPLATPSTTLWSATTCAPFPDDPAAIRHLAVEHVVRPVRFRELILALHEDGACVFVQVGTGSLVGFVDDTLRGREHLAISANVPLRSGLAQLRRVAAAILVEGGDPRMERLEGGEALSRGQVTLRLGVPLVRIPQSLALRVPSEARPSDALLALAEDDPLAAELAASLREIEAAREDVVGALHAARESAARAEHERIFVREVSVDAYPFLIDHAFYRQAAGWPSLPDRYPVVPMTMIMAMMLDIARELAPGLVPIALARVRAYRWLAVAPPVELTIHARFDGESKVEITIEGYAAGVVELAAEYPPAPSPKREPLDGERPAPISAAELYAQRWMFHGPAYQGVVALGPIAPGGIRGTLRSLAAQGGLLDNAGQLLGYWVMQNASVDRLAMPVIIDRCAFFGPEPPPGARLECSVRILELGPSVVRADVELERDGRVWARIDNWEDRRFDTDARVWDVLMFPEKNVIAVMREDFGWVTQPWRSSASRDLLARRYLGAREREVLEKLGPRAKNDWLIGRMAIKDCVRNFLWQRGHGPLFPAEIEVHNEPSGRPVVRGPFEGPLHVSVAHEDGVAVARVSSEGPVGIDLTKIRPRGPDFEAIAFTEAERASLPLGGERDTWIARYWVAKEAAGKAIGTGLGGNPARFVVTDLDDARVLVRAEGRVVSVQTTTEKERIVGWT